MVLACDPAALLACATWHATMAGAAAAVPAGQVLATGLQAGLVMA